MCDGHYSVIVAHVGPLVLRIILVDAAEVDSCCQRLDPDNAVAIFTCVTPDTKQ